MVDTNTGYVAFVDDLVKRRPALSSQYLTNHAERIAASMACFGLQDPPKPERALLEIGPYVGLTPLYYKAIGYAHVAALEGDVGQLNEIGQAYQEASIELVLQDLTEFGTAPGQARLPFPDNTFDVVVCWETMEHFNFNVLPFLWELARVLKPGGEAAFTVPNMARLESRARLLVGRGISSPVAELADQLRGNTFGLHWREYTMDELVDVVEYAGFEVLETGFLQVFQGQPRNARQRMKRAVAQATTKIAPSTSLCCTVRARAA